MDRMDFKDEQMQELDALQAIYPDVLEMECETYPNIRFNLSLSSIQEENTSDSDDDQGEF